MIFKYQYLLLAFVIFFHVSYAQPAPAQKEGFKLFFEKVYLHLDRSYYAPGDDIWFKAYLVNASNNLPLNTSNNLYVELIDPKATIISRRVIRIDSTGIGDFTLPDSAEGGTYRVRAYTNWMRNFGNHFIFEKEIYIADIPQVKQYIGVNKTSGKTNKVVIKDPSYKIQFLPEGGNMVENVPSLVSFKAEDANGRGVDATGYILSPAGAKIAKFKSTHLGMGSFEFIPGAHNAYKAFVQFANGVSSEVPFPAALPTGYIMNVQNSRTDSAIVSIKSNAATSKINSTGVVNLTARHAGKSYFKRQIRLENDSATVYILKKDFPAGIAAITLYDKDMHPNCERLIYVDKESGLNVEMSTDKNAYRSREKMSINIAVTDAKHQPVKTALSVAVAEAGADMERSGDIVSYLQLESDLKGKIENVFEYFNKENPSRLQQLDLLLLTQGWRSFLWRQIADTTFHISYLPEPGVTVSGSVVKPFTNKPMADMNITLFAPDARGDKIYLTKTNSYGKYFLDGLPLYGIQNLKLNVGDGGVGKRVGEIKMDTVFNNPLPVTIKPFYFVDGAGYHSFEKLASARWSKFGNNHWARMLPNVTVTSRTTTLLRDGSALVNFGYPEYHFTITSDDYKYQRLRDFLVQKVDGARYDDDLEGVYFLADGKPSRPIIIVNKNQDVFDRMDYYSLSMQQIESVNVRHMVGSPTYNGIDNIGNELDMENFRLQSSIRDYFLITLVVKPGNLNQQLSKINASINGYYEARRFYAPNYSTEKREEEDNRVTIHWAPIIITDESGKAKITFYNADPKARIRVNLQGLTTTGIPISANMTYDVK